MFLVSSCSCFAKSIEARGYVENGDVDGGAALLQLRLSDQQIYSLLKWDLY